MNVDKFGHHVFKKQKTYSQTDPSIANIENVCFDARQKKFKNVGIPTNPEDCATKQYVDESVQTLTDKLDVNIKSINQTVSHLNPVTKKYIDKAIDNLCNKLDVNIKSINNLLTQTEREINCLKNFIDSLSGKVRKK